MRDRLTRLIDGFVFGTQIVINNLEWSSETCNELADYLIGNGVIVPPCKVGQTVYQTDDVRIYKSTIKNTVYDTENIAFDERAIGKTVFLTKEEAERALAERKGKQ